MIVSMDKKYTMGHEEFTLLTVTRPGTFPVAGHDSTGRIFSFGLNGVSAGSSNDLVEVSPFADFKVDEPVMVRDVNQQAWLHRYFAGVDAEGKVLVWMYGATKWSAHNNETAVWNQCRRPTAEELAS